MNKKRCSQCKKTKLITMYDSLIKDKNKLFSECKECRKIRNARYYSKKQLDKKKDLVISNRYKLVMLKLETNPLFLDHVYRIMDQF